MIIYYFFPQAFWHIQCMQSMLSYVKWRAWSRGKYCLPQDLPLSFWIWVLVSRAEIVSLHLSSRSAWCREGHPNHSFQKVATSYAFFIFWVFNVKQLWMNLQAQWIFTTPGGGWFPLHKKVSSLKSALKHDFLGGFLKAVDISDNGILAQTISTGMQQREVH